MPALDEEEAIGSVLAEIPAGSVDGIVVVDNGSADDTARVARDAGAFVVREERRGYGQACLTGLASVFHGSGAPPAPFGPLGSGDAIVFLDADHSDFPEELPSIVGPVLAGDADLVIGSRVLGGATMDALLPQAWWGNRLACLLMRLLFGARAAS